MADFFINAPICALIVTLLRPLFFHTVQPPKEHFPTNLFNIIPVGPYQKSQVRVQNASDHINRTDRCIYGQNPPYEEDKGSSTLEARHRWLYQSASMYSPSPT